MPNKKVAAEMNPVVDDPLWIITRSLNSMLSRRCLGKIMIVGHRASCALAKDLTHLACASPFIELATHLNTKFNKEILETEPSQHDQLVIRKI